MAVIRIEAGQCLLVVGIPDQHFLACGSGGIEIVAGHRRLSISHEAGHLVGSAGVGGSRSHFAKNGAGVAGGGSAKAVAEAGSSDREASA